MINRTSKPNFIQAKIRTTFPHKILTKDSPENSAFLKEKARMEFIGNEKLNSEFEWSKSFDIPDESNPLF